MNSLNRGEMLDTEAGAMESKDDPIVVKAALTALRAGRVKGVPMVENKVTRHVRFVTSRPVANPLDEPKSRLERDGGCGVDLPDIAG